MHYQTGDVGTPPGTLLPLSDRTAQPVEVRAFTYTPGRIEERRTPASEGVNVPPEDGAVAWINVNGIHDSRLLGRIGETFGIHPLVLEDIQTTEQRPKADDYGRYMFFTLKMLHFDDDHGAIVSEQVSLVLGKSFVISFQEREGDVFEPIRRRLQQGKGRIRSSGADYLLYALIDAVVDNYFLILERLEEQMDEIEGEVLLSPERSTLRRIYHLKHQTLQLRRSVWPLREVIGNLEKRESGLITRSTTLYLRDIYDHAIQVMDTVEMFRETTSSLLDVYLSNLSHRMNAVMKVLTVIATIFIPLTFIVGVYGMNFRHMPELDWPWAYPALWGLMLIVTLGMIALFKRKGWF